MERVTGSPAFGTVDRLITYSVPWAINMNFIISYITADGFSGGWGGAKVAIALTSTRKTDYYETSQKP